MTNTASATCAVSGTPVIAVTLNCPLLPVATGNSITYSGTAGFPVNGLTFTSSAFSDPQGAGTFSAMQWRIAEVSASNVVVTNPSQLRLEWDAAWDAPELNCQVGNCFGQGRKIFPASDCGDSSPLSLFHQIIELPSSLYIRCLTAEPRKER